MIRKDKLWLYVGNKAVTGLFFADHYGFVVSQQINNLDLNVSVAWLGSKLEQVMSMTDSEPFLTLNWEPNTMTRNRQLTRIALPLCRY